MTDKVDGKVKDLLDLMKEVIGVSTKEDIYKDGYYEGTIITWSNGEQVFYPYVPLQMVGVDPDPDSKDPVSFKTRYGLIGWNEGRPTEAEWRARREREREIKEAKTATKH